MLAQLSTPTISTNGNGHSNGNGHKHAAVTAPKAKRTTKRTRTTHRTKKDLILDTESKIEEFKEKLYEQATDNTSLLTGCYVNWFDSEIRSANVRVGRNVETRVRNSLDANGQAWKRAKELFVTLAPIVLAELTQDIATQIGLEYQNVDDLAAADVPANLRNLSLFELMEHIN